MKRPLQLVREASTRSEFNSVETGQRILKQWGEREIEPSVWSDFRRLLVSSQQMVALQFGCQWSRAPVIPQDRVCGSDVGGMVSLMIVFQAMDPVSLERHFWVIKQARGFTNDWHIFSGVSIAQCPVFDPQHLKKQSNRNKYVKGAEKKNHNLMSSFKKLQEKRSSNLEREKTNK